ncbi:MAG TPA: membrane protein insertase YidC, partial [Pseudomonadales bacterium]|nr:membrane protein insertase YidC [Pseudomonadales bacterium]
MNIQRYIILIALAVVSWLMIQQWNKDYVQTQSNQQNAVVNEETLSAVPAAPTAEPVVSDVPAQPTANSASTPAAAASAESTQLIQVDTDVFSIKIDPTGGDIVYVGLKQYPQSKQDSKPFILLNRTKDHTFIAQSGLVGENGTDEASGKRPLFKAAQTQFSLADGADTLEVPLTYTQANGAQITKTYVFARNNYKVDLRYDVKNNADKEWKGFLYTQLKRDNAADPSITNGLSSMPTYLGSAYWTPEKPFEKLKFGDFADKPVNISHKGGWMAVVQHYFVSAWIANPNEVTQYKTSVVGENHVFTSISPLIAVAPGQEKRYQVSLYTGPKIQKELKELSPGLELAVDYGILFFIAKVLFWLLTFYHGLIGNWG